MKSILLNVQAYNPKAAEQLEATFEALREVATAGKAWSAAHKDPEYAHCNTKYCVTSDQVREAVDALPDWITESEHE